MSLTVLAQNLKIIRKSLGCSQVAISEVLNIGFRSYVRYEAGERDAPVYLLIRIAKLGNLSLDRLMTTPLTLEELKTPDSDKIPTTPQQMEIIGGSLIEGRVMFRGLRSDHLVTTNKMEKKLLTYYRKLNRIEREKCLIDAEWNFNNPKSFGQKKQSPESLKKQKFKTRQQLIKIAKSIKIFTPLRII